MNTKSLILASLGIAMSVPTMAELGVNTPNSKFGTGEDSVRCVSSVSLFQNFAKQKNYKDMHESWKTITTECPRATQRAYTDGAFMLKWEIENEKDINKKKALFEELMNLYDLRIKYFGNVKKYPTYYILGRKSFDYINYAPTLTNDATKQKAYGWLKEAIEKGGEKNEAQVFQQYFILSDGIYKANPTVNRDLYIADYMKIMPMMTAAAANDSTFDASIGVVNRVFARSGAAECGTLDKAYASKIEANKNDKAFLNDVLKLYRIADCKESAVYFKGSAYLHAIEPTAASAAGMAAQAISKKDNSKAIQYLQEAIKLETSKSVKSDYYLNIANIYLSQKNYQACRSNAQSALAMDPTAGQAYIMIAYAYAYGYTSIDDDPVIQKTAFWAAVDKLEKAKAVDSSLASQANSLIASYKKQFPDKSELFMRGIKGGSYKVPGWIGETTTVR